MAAMSTALTEFSTTGNSRTFTRAGHTALDPKLVIQKRKVPAGQQSVAETTISVIENTVDSEGGQLPQKVSMSVTVRYPIAGQQAAIDDALSVLRDIVAGDEFANAVDTQEFLA